MVLLISLFNQGCQTRVQQSLYLKLIDSIDVSHASNNLNNDVYQTQHFKTDTTDYLLNISPENKSIHLITSNNKKSSEIVELKNLESRFRNDALEILWLYLNNDSLFVLKATAPPYKLLLIDSSGKEKDSWSFPDLKEKNNPVFIDINTFSQPFSYNRNHKEFTFTIHKPYYTQNDSIQFNTLNNKLCCSLEGDSVHIKKFFGKVPLHNRSLFLGYQGKIKSTVMNGLNVLSYSQSDSIYTYENYKKLKAYYAGAKDFTPYKEPFDYRKSNDRSYVTEKSETGDSYNDLIAGSNYLLRIVIRKKKFFIDSNGEKVAEKQQWSLVVLDKNLVYLGEIDMTNIPCDFSAIFPLGDNQFLAPSYETSYKFYRFEITY